MCGIIGIYATYTVNELLVSSLKSLQHRGQQAAGVATMDGNLMHLKKGLGLVKDVVTKLDMSYLSGNIGIGHVRFPTAGIAHDPEEAHPFYVNSPFGIMLAHNGNLTNAKQLRDEILTKNHRHVRTKSDSETLTNIFAYELAKLTSDNYLSNDKIFIAIENLNSRIEGAYATVSLIANYGLVAFRDPNGIRPLVLGKKEDMYMFASESCALEINGFTIIRDILPGEAVIITTDGRLESKICSNKTQLNICIFEFVYLARPDSVMEKVSIQLARRQMGIYLANKIKKYNLVIDIVVPTHNASRILAIEVAQSLNKPYREGFVRNHLIGSTNNIRNRLNPIAVEFIDKNVLLIDYSMVRGTTSKEIVSMVRRSNAKKVYLASAAPQIKFPNVYGIDMPSSNELIAYKQTDEQIANQIGADQVIFQELEDLKKAIMDINPEIKNFEASCFDGCYVSGQIDTTYLQLVTSIAE